MTCISSLERRATLLNLDYGGNLIWVIVSAHRTSSLRIGAGMEADFAYFNRRSQEEREAAIKAPHPAARHAHSDMAERYRELAEAIDTHHRAISGGSLAS
jgi:hypothetical protein